MQLWPHGSWGWIPLESTERYPRTTRHIDRLYMVCLPFLSVASLHGFSMLSLQQNILTSYTMACMHAHLLSCIWLFVTPWTVAHQAPLSMGFSRQKYWSGLPFPHPVIEPTSFMSPVLAGGFFTASTTWEAPIYDGLGFPKAPEEVARVF